jgi:hypothetical protein
VLNRTITSQSTEQPAKAVSILLRIEISRCCRKLPAGWAEYSGIMSFKWGPRGLVAVYRTAKMRGTELAVWGCSKRFVAMELPSMVAIALGSKEGQSGRASEWVIGRELFIARDARSVAGVRPQRRSFAAG